ncbi:hypothetical protein LMH87_011330 [Akanthomyces muscarius]|uniref:Enoyl reductase (ER) domain-containing protein n=1 Tax=Akanthomyces muscarius TaxID=2231603 RepID=A0A9W8QB35_AKAMU|nr:hypothetical protein LMH87_011330 [Akanthomyces muscarius]KAJ4150587.1 hypothetical protein LMH87_011330 [Akanthomyces muscarius]
MPDSKSIICTAAGKLEIQSVPKQKLPPGYVLVKTKAVALNPTDWKAIDNPAGFAIGTRPGVDFAGIVEEVGPDVTKDFQQGDRVCGVAFGTKDRDHGAFGEFTMTKEHVLVKIPDHLSFEQAATLGVGVTTCGQALYQLLDLPLPPAAASEPQQTILIGGGSTATAVLGIQYARLSGLRVIATASPYNFDYLRSLGAEVLLDYHEPVEELVKKIRAVTGDDLTRAWDCSPNEQFPQVAALSLSKNRDGIYASVNPLTPPDLLRDKNPKVEAKCQLGYTAFGESFERGKSKFPASQEDARFAGSFWELSAKLLAEKKLQPTKPTVDQGGKGLEGVIAGLENLRQGKVSGTKLVYTL